MAFSPNGLVRVAAVVCALVVSACGSAGGSGSVTTSTSAVVTTSTPMADATGTFSLSLPDGPTVEGSNVLTPVANLVNVRATQWQRVTGTGRDLVVHWTSAGLAPCSLLSRVDVAESADTVRITVYTGEAPGVRCGVPPSTGLPLAAPVTLAADRGTRAVVDGAR